MKVIDLTVLLLLGEVINPCAARSVCQMISDGVRRKFPLPEVNECYRCQGWYKAPGIASARYPSSNGIATSLSGNISWCAESTHDYLEVRYDEPKKLAGFRMSSTYDDAWVKSLHVYYLDRRGRKSYARDHSRKKLFVGNTDGVRQKEHSFFIPVTSKSIRVHVKSYEGKPCLTIQFYSCDYSDHEENHALSVQRSYAATYERQTVKRNKIANKCPINVNTDCGNKKCFLHLKDEEGCKRCECDAGYKNADFLEGDIVIDSQSRAAAEQEYGYRKDPENLMRNGITNEQARWVDYPSGNQYIIPYVFEDSLEKFAQDRIVQAMEGLQAVTCLKFQQRTNQQYFLSFFRDGGCYSYVGNIKRANGQQISIGNGCEHITVIQHEILHALGFWHEQSRGDRDDFVRIFHENIKSGMEGNFEKRTTNSYGSKYDYDSVMHYSNKAFSSNGKDTIQAINDPNLRLGQRDAMTTEDINQVNAMYQCQSTTTVTSKAATTTTADTTTTTTNSTATTSTKTATTKSTPATTTTIGTCGDSSSQCKYWASKGYCSDIYQSFMERKCKKSCGLCECQDSIDCSSLEELCGYEYEEVKDFMHKNCRRTCDLCSA